MDEFGQTAEPVRSAGVTSAVQHALGWLVVGNAMGVMIAILLLLPQLNPWLGEWTYGRWMMVHMNTALYGWCSLPMIALLFRAYAADSGALAAWCRPVASPTGDARPGSGRHPWFPVRRRPGPCRRPSADSATRPSTEPRP